MKVICKKVNNVVIVTYINKINNIIKSFSVSGIKL
jgi:hypothetical protein